MKCIMICRVAVKNCAYAVINLGEVDFGGVPLQTITKNGYTIAIIDDTTPVIADAQSALDLMATLRYEHECERLAISKDAISMDFFALSTGLAGEILQKFSNYHFKAAIYGDFSVYKSKPLHDFIYESNNGNSIFFTTTAEEALERLSAK